MNWVLLPAKSAAGSATAGRFTFSSTNSECENSLDEARISAAAMKRIGTPSASAAASRPASSALTSAEARRRTSSRAIPASARALWTAATIRSAGVPRRQPIPTITDLSASVVVVMTGSAPRIFATRIASAFAPPSWPESRLTAQRPPASRTTTAGSSYLLSDQRRDGPDDDAAGGGVDQPPTDGEERSREVGDPGKPLRFQRPRNPPADSLRSASIRPDSGWVTHVG